MGVVVSDALLSDLPRGDPDRAPEDRFPNSFKHQSARFATPRAIRDTDDLSYDNNPAGIFLGVVDGTVKRRDIARERHVMGGYPVGIEDDRHILTVAGSRAGKGRAIIIPNMLHYPGSVLATDPKGELATITARRRHKGLKQSVHVLDPFKVARGNAAGLRRSFNPIMAMRPDSLVADAALIADALVIVSEKDAHWDESARTFIEGVILHVQSAPIYEKVRSLVTVQALIARGALDTDGKKRSLAALDAAMRSNPAGDGVVKDAAADFFDRTDKERASVLSTARRHLKFLNYPEIRGVVQEHNFQLSDLKTERTTIYLCLPASQIGTCARWLRLFINLTLQSMEITPATSPVPVLMVLDEFASLGKMRQIEDAAGQIAGFGVKLWPILQDLGQLKALYSERWETFMGNAGVLQFFGNNDLTTLEWISRRCGRTSIETTRTNTITALQSRDGAKGTSESIDVCELLAVDEAARFFNRDDPKHRQLVIWASAGRPLILQRVYYDKHQLFEGLFDDRSK